MSSRELSDWAGKQGISNWLQVSVARLDWSVLVSTERAWIEQAAAAEWDLRQLICAPSRPRVEWYAKLRKAPFNVQLQAIQTLGKQARIARQGVAEEAKRAARRQPPREPGLRALFDRLQAARAEIRQEVAPRPADRLGPMTLEVDADAEELECRERVTAVCGDNNWPVVTIALLSPRGKQPIACCACSQPKQPGRCTVVMAALDRALDIVGGVERKGDSTVAEEIREIVTKPRWSRALRRLDRVLPGNLLAPAGDLDADLSAAGRSTNPVSAQRPGWLLVEEKSFFDDDEGDTPRIRPVLCRPYKRRPGICLERCRWGQFAASLRHHYDAANQAAYDLLAPEFGQNFRWEMTADTQSPGLHLQALAALAGSSHLYAAGEGREGVPLSVQRAALTLRWRTCAGSKEQEFEVVARVGGRDWQPDKLWDAVGRQAPNAGFWALREADTITLIAASGAGADLLRALARSEHRFPAAALPAMLERLPAVSRILPVTLDPALRGTRVETERRPLARLGLVAGDALQLRLLVRPLAAGERCVPGAGSGEVYGYDGEERVFAQRDLQVERERARGVAEGLGLAAASEVAPFAWVIEEREAALDLLEKLQPMAEQELAAVEWLREQRLRMAGTATPAALQIRVRSIGDWFRVGGELKIGGVVVPLEQLLAAARQERQLVSVDGAAWVRLDAALRRCLRGLADVVADDAERTSALRAPAIEAIAGEAGVSIRAPRAWSELLARVRRAETIDTAPPADLQAELRPYQVEGQAWLTRSAVWSPGACLADDMGLGKTLQALALLLRRAEQGPALVVAPTSVGFNWVREARRFAPSLRARLYRGRERQSLLTELAPRDLLITSYQLAQRDIEQLAQHSFATLVLDESQAIKNPDTQRARAVARLRAEFRLALTGTPLENRLLELWSLFQILTPGLLGNRQHFCEHFVLPIERNGDADRRGALARLLRPFMLRRTKAAVAPELPPRTETLLEVELSPAERRLYEETRAAALVKLASQDGDPNQKRFQVLAALTRLRQIACHPRLVAESSRHGSAKLSELRGKLEELTAEGHRALIFSQFTRLLALVRQELTAAGIEYRYLDGGTPERKRRAEVDAFQRGEGDVFLISLKAGGTGLNLTAATYVFHLDPWWNPAVEDQASDRAHRIGQEHAVTVYRLVARNTVEESILALQEEKRKLVAGVLSGSGAAGSLSTDELLALLRETGSPPRQSTALRVADAKETVSHPANRAALRASPDTPSPPAATPTVATSAAIPASTAETAPGRVLFEEASDALGAMLDRDTAAGRLARQTAASYWRIGERFLDYLAERFDLLPPPPELVAEAMNYTAAVQAGEFAAPASDAALVATVARRLTTALERHSLAQKEDDTRSRSGV
jgi:hypothetical protein